MSIAVNSNINNYDYQKYLNETQGTASNKQNTYKELFNDLLNLSSEYAGGQSPQFLPTGNYAATTSEPNLTVDQKKAFLTNLETKLNSTDATAASGIPEKIAAARSTIKNDLTGFNASTTTDDQVNSLFKQVTDTFASAHPRRASHRLNSQNMGSLISMAANNQDGTSSSLTVDDMKTLLTNLADSLSSNSSESDNSSSSSSTLDTSLLDQLSGLDTSTTTDNQIQSLFSVIAEALQNSQTQGQDNTNLQQTSNDQGFPPILQASGSALPPFNWRPSSTL